MSTTTAKKPADKTVGAEIQDLFDTAYEETQYALAIMDAARVLCALERSPSHHDTHPSHNRLTGAGFAHGHTLRDDTLPVMLGHAIGLVQSAINGFDVARETAIDALEGGAA